MNNFIIWIIGTFEQLCKAVWFQYMKNCDFYEKIWMSTDLYLKFCDRNQN